MSLVGSDRVDAGRMSVPMEMILAPLITGVALTLHVSTRFLGSHIERANRTRVKVLVAFIHVLTAGITALIYLALLCYFNAAHKKNYIALCSNEKKNKRKASDSVELPTARQNAGEKNQPTMPPITGDAEPPSSVQPPSPAQNNPSLVVNQPLPAETVVSPPPPKDPTPPVDDAAVPPPLQAESPAAQPHVVVVNQPSPAETVVSPTPPEDPTPPVDDAAVPPPPQAESPTPPADAVVTLPPPSPAAPVVPLSQLPDPSRTNIECLAEKLTDTASALVARLMENDNFDDRIPAVRIMWEFYCDLCYAEGTLKRMISPTTRQYEYLLYTPWLRQFLSRIQEFVNIGTIADRLNAQEVLDKIMEDFAEQIRDCIFCPTGGQFFCRLKGASDADFRVGVMARRVGSMYGYVEKMMAKKLKELRALARGDEENRRAIIGFDETCRDTSLRLETIPASVIDRCRACSYFETILLAAQLYAAVVSLAKTIHIVYDTKRIKKIAIERVLPLDTALELNAAFMALQHALLAGKLDAIETAVNEVREICGDIKSAYDSAVAGHSVPVSHATQPPASRETSAKQQAAKSSAAQTAFDIRLRVEKIFEIVRGKIEEVESWLGKTEHFDDGNDLNFERWSYLCDLHFVRETLEKLKQGTNPNLPGFNLVKEAWVLDFLGTLEVRGVEEQAALKEIVSSVIGYVKSSGIWPSDGLGAAIGLPTGKFEVKIICERIKLFVRKPIITALSRVCDRLSDYGDGCLVELAAECTRKRSAAISASVAENAKKCEPIDRRNDVLRAIRLHEASIIIYAIVDAIATKQYPETAVAMLSNKAGLMLDLKVAVDRLIEASIILKFGEMEKIVDNIWQIKEVVLGIFK
ncbi:MAG: hypothetical protein LBB38_02955 [Puniceicoccales bacterium]|nr:hypothetical protein [Puniceicoccales bacterium]